MKLRIPRFKNWPVWSIHALSTIGTVITGVVTYLLFKPETEDQIDAFMLGLAVAGISVVGSGVALIRDLSAAADALASERRRVMEYEVLVERALETISIVHGGQGIPKIRIQVMQSWDHDRYPIWFWIENHDKYPIHDLRIVITDPELYPPIRMPADENWSEREDIASSDQYHKGFREVVGPFTLPALFSEVVYKTPLRIEAARAGGYQVQVRWRKGSYTLIIPYREIVDFLPVFELPVIIVNGMRLVNNERSNYYYFDSYIDDSIRHAKNMKARFFEGKARYSHKRQ